MSINKSPLMRWINPKSIAITKHQTIWDLMTKLSKFNLCLCASQISVQCHQKRQFVQDKLTLWNPIFNRQCVCQTDYRQFVLIANLRLTYTCNNFFMVLCHILCLYTASVPKRVNALNCTIQIVVPNKIVKSFQLWPGGHSCLAD